MSAPPAMSSITSFSRTSCPALRSAPRSTRRHRPTRGCRRARCRMSRPAGSAVTDGESSSCSRYEAGNIRPALGALRIPQRLRAREMRRAPTPPCGSLFSASRKNARRFERVVPAPSARSAPVGCHAPCSPVSGQRYRCARLNGECPGRARCSTRLGASALRPERPRPRLAARTGLARLGPGAVLCAPGPARPRGPTLYASAPWHPLACCPQTYPQAHRQWGHTGDANAADSPSAEDDLGLSIPRTPRTQGESGPGAVGSLARRP